MSTNLRRSCRDYQRLVDPKTSDYLLQKVQTIHTLEVFRFHFEMARTLCTYYTYSMSKKKLDRSNVCNFEVRLP